MYAFAGKIMQEKKSALIVDSLKDRKKKLHNLGSIEWTEDFGDQLQLNAG